MNIDERFWAKVDRRAEDECWPWTAYVSAHHGYGRFSVDGAVVGAHRVAYELVNGPIPLGLQIDHLCRRRDCVNPAHLEAVTQSENLRRGIGTGPARAVSAANRRAMTHCKHGHEFTSMNTHMKKGRRQCRKCDSIRRLKVSRPDRRTW